MNNYHHLVCENRRGLLQLESSCLVSVRTEKALLCHLESFLYAILTSCRLCLTNLSYPSVAGWYLPRGGYFIKIKIPRIINVFRIIEARTFPFVIGFLSSPIIKILLRGIKPKIPIKTYLNHIYFYFV